MLSKQKDPVSSLKLKTGPQSLEISGKAPTAGTISARLSPSVTLHGERMGVLRFINLKTLSLLELVVHSVCIAISAIATGFSAHSIYETEFFFDDTLNFTPLVLAISAASIILLSLSLLLTVFRRQPFLTRISVELVWSGFLWIAWFATAGYVIYSDTCPYFHSRFATPVSRLEVCEVHAVLASMSFVAAALLFLHWMTLLIVGHQVSDGSQRTWNMSLKELALRSSSLTRPLADHHEETNKFEYDQPSVTAFPPAYSLPPHLIIPSTVPSTPSPIYSHDPPIQPAPFNLSYPENVHIEEGWHHSHELPDGYEMPRQGGTLPLALRRAAMKPPESETQGSTGTPESPGTPESTTLSPSQSH
ncbi:hypothetical protein V5O48_000833 [Marasmius crinis-equi]|uniref:MARVEL domain-containing protein n=1 Tax=Marasmius crinis-equi TaxID=585013 RepID=A0ABR3G0Y5_9AGAR